jgi:hypothetical protein
MRPILSLALLLCTFQPARATVIGLGLDWRKNVFVQEYWRDGKPGYVIANLRKDPVKVGVHEWNRGQAGKQIAGPWEVKGKGVLSVDASPVRGGGLLMFMLADGDSLGLLPAPAAPANPPRDVLLTYNGLNGSGGSRLDLWCEQKTLAFPSGGTIELRLMLPPGSGVVAFKKTKSVESPPEALIAEAACATLPVQAGDKDVRIDANKPLKDQKLHAVTLHFKAPEVDAPTLVVCNGWFTLAGGGGFTLTRGVIVEPRK